MIPKGMVEAGEEPAEAALREFEEEIGTSLDAVPLPLATVRQAGGKRVEAFAIEGDLDAAAIRSNDIRGRMAAAQRTPSKLPRIRQARWMGLAEARAFMLPSQLPLIDALEARLKE